MSARKLGRREWLRWVIGGAGSLGAGAFASGGARARLFELAGQWDESADVVVVGYGAAGAAAAIEAHDAGARVVVVEKGPGPAGATPASTGIIWLPMHPLQEEPDSIEKVVQYLAACAKGQADPALIRTFASRSAETGSWLLRCLGLRGSQKNRYDFHMGFPGAGRGRAIDADDRGAGLMQVLDRAVRARKISVQPLSKAEELVINQAGRVTGVIVTTNGSTRRIRAVGGVVLAAGGFSWNEEMKKQFLRIYPVLGQVPGLMGEGILLGMSVGAAVEAMNEFVGALVFWIPGTKRGAPVAARTARSCILVNRCGRRFCDESADPDSVVSTFYAYDLEADTYANVPGWLIFDERVRRAGAVVSEEGWSQDNRAEIEAGWIRQADSLSELARLIGVDAAGLEATVAEYNRYAIEGEDPLFGRGRRPDARWPSPIVGPPYYALPVHPGMYDTVGGLKINERAEVVSVLGRVIPGLYAAGTTAHMALGFFHPNSGGCLGQALVFGRIAGRSAAMAARVA